MHVLEIENSNSNQSNLVDKNIGLLIHKRLCKKFKTIFTFLKDFFLIKDYIFLYQILPTTFASRFP